MKGRFNRLNPAVLGVALILTSFVLASCSDEPLSSEMTIAFPLTVAQTTPLAEAPGANGDAVLVIDPNTGSISGSAVVSGLSSNAIAAHIHVGAVGVVGDIIVTLEGSDESNTADGIDETWTVPADTLLESTQLALFKCWRALSQCSDCR